MTAFTFMRIPVTAMKRSHWLMLVSLYTTSFLGPGFFHIALVAIMRSQGDSLARLSIVYLLGAFWVLKFLWAPLVDRFGIRAMGHYRGWIIMAQTAMVLTLLLLGRFDVATEFNRILPLWGFLAFSSATQDIATDALACRILPPDQRGLGNGIQSFGGLLGNLLGGGVVLMMYPHIGWQGCMWVMALVTGLVLVQILCFREPCQDLSAAPFKTCLERYWLFWKQPGRGRWLVTLAVFPIGVCTGYGLLTPILVDSGWPMEDIGFVINAVGNPTGMAASVLTGWLIRRLGRRVMLIATGVVQALALPILLLPVMGHTNNAGIYLAVAVFFATYGAVIVVLTTLMMDQANLVNPATDYTLQHSVYSVAGMISVSLGTAAAGYFGYTAVLLAGAAFAFMALFFIPGIQTRRDIRHPG